MKKTYTLYLNVALYSRVSTALKHALDNRTTFADFLNFVGYTAPLRLLRPIVDREKLNTPFVKKMIRKFGEPHFVDEVDEKTEDMFHTWLSLAPGKLIEPLDDYISTWRELERGLPWHSGDPAASHVLALSVLRARPLAWASPEPKAKWMNDIEYGFNCATVDTYMSPLWRAVYEVGSNHLAITGQDDDDKERQLPIPIWRRNRLDLVLPSRSEAVSLYLNDNARLFINDTFGSGLYSAILEALDRCFSDDTLVAKIYEEVMFLQTDPMSVTVEELYELAKEIAVNKAKLSDTSTDTDIHLTAHFKKVVKYFADLNHFHPPETKSSLWSAYMVFVMASRLGVLTANSDLTTLVQETVAAFMKHYKTHNVLPTRTNIKQVLEVKIDLLIHRQYFSAVEFHIWELFKLFASDILENSVGAPRLADSMLVTLAQRWVLKVPKVLERFSSSTVKLRDDGVYEFSKSRRVFLEMSIRQAHAFTVVLETLVDDVTIENDPQFAGEHAGMLQEDLREYCASTDKPVSFRLGEQFIVEAFDIFRNNEWNIGKTIRDVYSLMLERANTTLQIEQIGDPTIFEVLEKIYNGQSLVPKNVV